MKHRYPLELSPEQAYEHGKECREHGKPLSYNPYRNLKTHDEQFTQWVTGWQHAKLLEQ